MAYQSTTHLPSGSFWTTFSAAFMRVMTRMMETSSIAQRARRAEYLMQKSDEDLAALGLKRADIPNVVFGDMYYV